MSKIYPIDDSHYSYCLIIGFWCVVMQNYKTLVLFEQMADAPCFIVHYHVTLQHVQMLFGFQKYPFIHLSPKMHNVIFIQTTRKKDTNVAINNSNNMIFIKDDTTMIVTHDLIDIENVEKSDSSNIIYSDCQAKSIESNAFNRGHDIATIPELVGLAGMDDLQYILFCDWQS